MIAIIYFLDASKYLHNQKRPKSVFCLMEEKYYSGFIKIMLCIGDLLLINLAFFISRQFEPIQNLDDMQFYSFFLIFAFSWITTGLLTRIYDISKYSLMRSISINLLSTLLVHFLLINGVLYRFSVLDVNIKAVITLYIFTGMIMAGSRVLYKLIRKYFEFSGFDSRKVIIVGTTRSGRALHDFFITHDPSGYIFKGFFDNYPNPAIVDRSLVKGTIDELKDYCKRENIDEIYFALPPAHKELLERLAKFSDDNCIYFRIAPDFSEVVRNSYIYLYDSIPVFTSRKEPLGISVNAGLKRLFDIMFSLAVITFVLPLVIPVIALAIKLDSKGPVIFKQLRPGKKNKLFECYKFRTMRVNNIPEKMATKDDPRITKVGAFLRKTSLDELPQFFNVLLGDMSVVGPRPNMVSQLEEYSRTIKKYRVRHFITPGITGYAQVNGCRGELKEKDSMEKRVEYDVAYMENWSMFLDMKIILQTIQKIVKGDKHAY